MKKILLSLAVFATQSFANEMPEYMKNGIITVTLADGKQYTFSSNAFKVVPRVQESKEEGQDKGSKKLAVASKKNRITVHGGGGFVGLKSKTTGSNTEVSQRGGAIGGVSLSHSVTEDYSISGTALSNKTFLLGVGLDF